MAATVKIFRITGASGSTTDTDITSINTRLLADDTHTTAGTTNPVRIPTTGTNYSYWATLRLKVTSNTANATISNMKWYTDGTNNLGTGVGLNVAAASAYVQATGTQGTTGDEMSANHTGLITSVTGAFNYTSSNPLSINTSNTGTSSTGYIGDYVVLQLTVDSTASTGATPQETITFQWDEA